MLCHHNTHFFVVTCMRIMLSWHRRSLTKHFQSELFDDSFDGNWKSMKSLIGTDKLAVCRRYNKPTFFNIEKNSCNVALSKHYCLRSYQPFCMTISPSHGGLTENRYQYPVRRNTNWPSDIFKYQNYINPTKSL